MSRTPRRGISFIEIVVIVGIIALLLAFLVPAVQKVREAAARTQTINNLKQMGLGVYGVNDVYKRLPPGYGNNFGPVIGNPNGADSAVFLEGSRPAARPRSLHVHVLPYVEYDRLYVAIINSGADSNVVDVASLTNGKPPFGAPVGNYQSPLDFTTENFHGVQNFAANFRIFCNGEFDKKVTGPNWTWPALPNPATAPKGANPWDWQASIPRTFTDGTSNTIMFATRYARCGTKDGAGLEGGSFYAPHPGTPYGAFFGVVGANVGATQKATIDSRPIFQSAPTMQDCNPSPGAFAQALHPYGIQVCLADISCRTITTKMSVGIWNLALQPNDGQKMPRDWND